MVTQSYQGWNTSLDKCDNFNDLPIETKSYISAMSSLLRVPITMISSGPERRKLMGVPR